jgi:hypothetical protein
MNIIIPLGTGSRWNNNELRYCLRSIEKHLTGWEKIVIVGVLPDWIKENDRLVFIQANDKPGAQHKEENIHRKSMKFIDSVYAGESFLFMNDDHFLLQDFEAAKFPYHHKGKLGATIISTPLRNPYHKSLVNTYKRTGNAYNHDTHCPIIYRSDIYKRIDIPFPKYGYCIKSLYCHYAGIEGEYYPDCKLGSLDSKEAIHGAIDGRPYFSIGNKAIGEALREVMEELYPVPSAFEIDLK